MKTKQNSNIELFNYFKEKKIDYCLTNGYKDIFLNRKELSDTDILIRKKDFPHIEEILHFFCQENSHFIVQVLHHDSWAKNIFLYNKRDETFLNLDIYGEFSRKGIALFEEDDIFKTLEYYKKIPKISAEKEFITYLIKRLDKQDFTEENNQYLRELFTTNSTDIKKTLCKFLPKTHASLLSHFSSDSSAKELNILKDGILEDFYKNTNRKKKYPFLNAERILKRIFKPTGLTVAFLGPDGSGKSTIINEIQKSELPFRRIDYFHLKPLYKKNMNISVNSPHKNNCYSPFKSYLKILFFLAQYNYGWLKNIVPLKTKSSLIIFDRYYEDILADNKRYLYGGKISFVKFLGRFVPKPDLYFILTAKPDIIYNRKKEVEFNELGRQVRAYRALTDSDRYNHIDVDQQVCKIVSSVKKIMMEKMNERY